MAFGSILLAALGIGLLIFIHELGHFLAARLAGVRVEVFSLGFGSRLCGVVWRGTDFRLSLVPFGGFVMVAGQDPGDRRYPAKESLWSKTPGQRALFWSGGVLMNLLFALIAFPIVFSVGVEFSAPAVGRVFAGGAAWEAGLQPGDRVLTVAGKAIHSFENLAVEIALAGARGVPLQVRTAAGEERTVQVLPQWNANDGRYELGIGEPADPAFPILDIAPGSAGARAGLQNGDTLLAINELPTTGKTLWQALELLQRDGQPLALRIRQGDAERTVTVAPAPMAEPAPSRIGVRLLPRVVAGLRHGASFPEQLGLRRGDVLLAIDGVPFTSGSLAAAAAGAGPLALQVRRDGQPLTLTAPATAAERAALANEVALKVDDSLMLLPEPDRPAALAGLLAGDRIESVDGKPVRTFEDLQAAVEGSGGKTLAVVVQRLVPGGAEAWLDPASSELRLAEKRSLRIAPAPPLDTGVSPLLRPHTNEVRAKSFGEALRRSRSTSSSSSTSR